MNSGHSRSYFRAQSLPPGEFNTRSKSTGNIFGADKELNLNRPSSNSRDQLEFYRLQIEEELESLIDITSKGYKKVTIPVSVKYAVTLDRPPKSINSVMARPRSPSKFSTNTDLLDQTLLNIRMKLNSLNSDRIEMENKMEELMTGIKTFSIHYCNQCTLHPPQSPASSIRRVRSSTTPNKRPDHLIVTVRDENGDNVSLSQDQADDTCTNLSQDTSTLSASSPSSSLGSNQYSNRIRSESAGASLTYSRSKNLPALLGHSSETNLTSLNEMTMAIHELPESPRSSISSSNSSLYTYSIFGTTPRNPRSFKRSFSTSSPPLSSVHSKSIMTSTPNVSQSTDEGRNYYHTLPNMAPSNRNSLPESIMITVIPEDQVDDTNCSDSLSQLSSCMEEGSPKCGSTIVRRSSLTGQIEHYRKSRSQAKTSFKPKDFIMKCPKQIALSNPTWSEPNYKVLNKKSSRRKSSRLSQILPGIETTV